MSNNLLNVIHSYSSSPSPLNNHLGGFTNLPYRVLYSKSDDLGEPGTGGAAVADCEFLFLTVLRFLGLVTL